MPKLFSSNEILKVLEKFKFKFISQKGSHGKFRDDKGRTVILPMNKREIPIGTFKSIIKQSGIDYKVFMENIS